MTGPKIETELDYAIKMAVGHAEQANHELAALLNLIAWAHASAGAPRELLSVEILLEQTRLKVVKALSFIERADRMNSERAR